MSDNPVFTLAVAEDSVLLSAAEVAAEKLDEGVGQLEVQDFFQ